MPIQRSKRIVVPVEIDDIGLDSGSDPKILSTIIKAENAIYPRRNTIEKRTGLKRLNANVTGVPNRVVSNGSVPLMLGVDAARFVSPDLDAEYTIDSQSVRIIDIVKNDIDAAGENIFPIGDASSNTNYNAVAFIADTKSDIGFQFGRIKTFDKNFNLINSFETGYIAETCRILRIGTADVVYVLETGGVRSVHKYNISSSGVISFDETTTSTVDVASRFDAASTGSTVGFVYIEDGTTNLTLLLLPNGQLSGSPSPITITSSVDNTTPFCIFAAPSSFVVVWIEVSGATQTLRAIRYDETLGTILTANSSCGTWNKTTEFLPRAICGIESSYSGRNVYTVFVSGRTLGSSSSNISHHTLQYQIDPSGGTFVGTKKNTYYRTFLSTLPSKVIDDDAFPDNWTKWIIGFYTESWAPAGSTETKTSQSQYLWMFPDFTEEKLKIIGKSSVGKAWRKIEWHTPLAGSASEMFYTLSSVLRQKTTERTRDVGFTILKWFVTEPKSYQVSTHEIDIAFSENVPTVLSDDVIHIGGSLGFEIDGENVVEQGFLQIPEPLHAVQIAGSNLAAGTYLLKATYEWRDAKGRRHESAPTTEPFSITLSTTAAIRAYVPTLTLTRKENVRIVLWRTNTNGTIFSRVASEPNDLSLSELTIDDDTAFDDEFEQLYTTGGVLENTAVPSYRASVIYNDRQFIVDADSNELRYSKEKISGLPFEHNEVLGIGLGEQVDAITALETISDKLILFSSSQIHATEGNPLNAIGAGDNLVRPYMLSGTIGCVDHRTVVRIPQGIVFLSADGGLWLLGNDLQTKPIGDPVRYYTDTYSIVSSGIIRDKHYAIWITDDGPALVYDYLLNRWSTFSGHSATSAATIDDRLHMLIGNRIWRDNRSDYRDNNVYVGLRIETGSISLGRILGYARLHEILLIMQNLYDHTLRVKIAYDHDPAWTDNFTFDAGTLQTFSHADYFGDGLSLATYVNQAYVLRIEPSRQRCMSFRLFIADEDPDPGGDPPNINSRGFSLNGLSVHVAVKHGVMRVGSSRTI